MGKCAGLVGPESENVEMPSHQGCCCAASAHGIRRACSAASAHGILACATCPLQRIACIVLVRLLDVVQLVLQAQLPIDNVKA